MRRWIIIGVALALCLAWMLVDKKPAKAQPAPTLPTVEVTTVALGHIPQQLHLQGSVFAAESVEIRSEVEGRLSKIAVRSGAHVKRGQLLFQLDDRHQQAKLAKAKAQLQELRRQHQDWLSLLPRGAVTQSQVDRSSADIAMAEAELTLAQAELDDRSIRAAFDGQIGLVDLSIGQLVSPSEVLTSLDDLSKLRLNVPVASQHLSSVELGQQAMLHKASGSQPEIQATVSSIDTRINPNSLNITLQLSIDNPPPSLRPGSLVIGQLELPGSERPVIPLQALAYEGHKRFVYRLDGAQVHKQEVLLGQRNANHTEVLEGIEAGEQVVLKGLVKLRDLTKVEVLN